MINQIQEDTGAEIAIEDDGTVFISSEGGEAAEKAKAIIDQIANPHVPEAGETSATARSSRPRRSALWRATSPPAPTACQHISQIRNLANGERIDAVEDVLKEGDAAEAIVQGVDDRGKDLLWPFLVSRIRRTTPARAVAIAMTAVAAVAVVTVTIAVAAVAVAPIAMTVTSIDRDDRPRRRRSDDFEDDYDNRPRRRLAPTDFEDDYDNRPRRRRSDDRDFDRDDRDDDRSASPSFCRPVNSHDRDDRDARDSP